MKGHRDQAIDTSWHPFEVQLCNISSRKAAGQDTCQSAPAYKQGSPPRRTTSESMYKAHEWDCKERKHVRRESICNVHATIC